MEQTTDLIPSRHLPRPQWTSALAAGSPLNSFIAGAIAGATEASITYPFEFAKTHVQLQGVNAAAGTSPLRALRSIIAHDGPSLVYKGCGSLIAGTALKASVRFFTFDAIKARLVDDQGKLSAGRGIVAGMAAGSAESLLAVTPTERIKTALIDDAKGARRFRSTSHAISTLLQEQGVHGIYRGLVSTTIKQCATSAVRMGSYNVLKSEFQQRVNSRPSVAATFCLGALAGTITVYATQPFDTIKTRAQGVRSESMPKAVSSILKQHGWTGLWKGSTMRLGRLVLSGGIVFGVYEQVSQCMDSLSDVSNLRG